LNIVTIATMSTLSQARSIARQQSLPPLHEIAAFGFVMRAYWAASFRVHEQVPNL
jgi:hypothetical protein